MRLDGISSFPTKHQSGLRMQNLEFLFIGAFTQYLHIMVLDFMQNGTLEICIDPITTHMTTTSKVMDLQGCLVMQILLKVLQPADGTLNVGPSSSSSLVRNWSYRLQSITTALRCGTANLPFGMPRTRDQSGILLAI